VRLYPTNHSKREVKIVSCYISRGSQNVDLDNLVGRTFKRITVQHDNICPLADFDQADDVIPSQMIYS
ncbi:MAG TPA: hypothetical protein VLM43_11815, partial [Desulfobacterales bacterium]|nr:hypothetical protein [Desulfobacterales bacterium]